MYRGGERGCRKSEMSNRERHLNHLGVRWESIIGKKRQMQKKKEEKSEKQRREGKKEKRSAGRTRWQERRLQ